jgi:hypothetical protein
MYKYYQFQENESSQPPVKNETPTESAHIKENARIIDGSEHILIPYKLEKHLSLDKYKLKYCLQKYETECTSNEFLWAAVGIFITVLITISTTNFKETKGFSAGAWEGFFLFVGVACLVVIIWIMFSKVWRIIRRGKIIGIQEVLKCVESEDPDNN